MVAKMLTNGYFTPIEVAPDFVGPRKLGHVLMRRSYLFDAEKARGVEGSSAGMCNQRDGCRCAMPMIFD